VKQANGHGFNIDAAELVSIGDFNRRRERWVSHVGSENECRYVAAISEAMSVRRIG
jgi:hypothetical protein